MGHLCVVRCELLGVTDHFSSMMHPEVPTGVDLRNYQHFLNFEVWPRTWHGVRLMHGCEADIGRNADDTCPDYCFFSVHFLRWFYI